MKHATQSLLAMSGHKYPNGNPAPIAEMQLQTEPVENLHQLY